MKKLHKQEEIEVLIKNNAMAVVYFTGNSCTACGVIKEKIQQILKYFPEILAIEINGEEFPKLAINYDVYSLPILLLYIEGKESIRVGRNVDLLELENIIARYYNMIYS